jgi:sulfite reductase beta subunit-like hemoprotein
VHAIHDRPVKSAFAFLWAADSAVPGHQSRDPRVPAAREILNYFDAIMRVYNRFGRRDNIYKARIRFWSK